MKRPKNISIKDNEMAHFTDEAKKPSVKYRKAPIRDEQEKDMLNMCEICGQQKGFITKTCHSCPDTTHSCLGIQTSTLQVARESMSYTKADLEESYDDGFKGGIIVGAVLVSCSMAIIYTFHFFATYLMNLPSLNP